jgi:hypothetical protein
MSKLLQLRGGTTSEHAAFIGALREVTVDTTKDTLVVHDGSTAGGFPMPSSADKTKIDTIETLATADQTDAEIRTAVESAADSNVFTDADHTKLNGIAASSNNYTHPANHAISVTTGLQAALDAKAPLASPALTGAPTAPTAAANTNTTQVATTAYVQTEITDLIGGAPSTLNDLNELAAAINDDASYASTLTTALATKVTKTTNQALSTAANAMTISGHTITLNRGDGTTDTVVVPDNNTDTNTTYTASTGMSLSGTAFSCTINTPSEVGLSNLSSNGNSLSGSFTASGNITAYSDLRLKSNIETIPSALEKVTSVRGVTFDMHGERATGVIAQELEAVLPEAVYDNDDGMKSVAYGNIVGLLIEAIKEQQAQIEELKGIVGSK